MIRSRKEPQFRYYLIVVKKHGLMKKYMQKQEYQRHYECGTGINITHVYQVNLMKQ